MKTPTTAHDTCCECNVSSSCFRQLNAESLSLLKKSKIEIQYKKGETICKQGTFASHIIFIREGLGKMILEQGIHEMITKIITPGSYIGLSSLHSHNTFPYTATAYTQCRACLFDISVFRTLSSNNPAFAIDIIKRLGKDHIEANNRLFTLTRKTLTGRVAEILLCLSHNIYHSNTLNLNITRKDLGELTGMSTESVIRVLSALKKEGTISTAGRTITILKREKLAQYSNKG